MAGSRKWYAYTINLDKSNTEIVNGGTNEYPASAGPADAVPRNIKPREIFYTSTNRERTIRCVALTSTIYLGAIAGGVKTIPDPIVPANPPLVLVRANGERRRVPVPIDTGLTDIAPDQ
jgi:hypothetical protein